MRLLINDFFAMIFCGGLRHVTDRWCSDRGALHNDLLCGDGGMISTEPARRMREMAEIAAGSTALIERLCDGSLDAILQEMERAPAFPARIGSTWNASAIAVWRS